MTDYTLQGTYAIAVKGCKNLKEAHAKVEALLKYAGLDAFTIDGEADKA
jgi:hypothetical protein